MKNVKEIGRIDFYKNRLLNKYFCVWWEVTSRCNLNCKYCAILHNNNIPFLNDDDINLVINNINNLEGKFEELEVYLYGGEPTFHPKFLDILEKLKNRNISLATNLSYSTDYLKKILDIGKINYIFTSFHYEKVNPKQFMDNFYFIKENYPNVEVYPVVMMEEEYMNEIMKYQEKIDGELRFVTNYDENKKGIDNSEFVKKYKEYYDKNFNCVYKDNYYIIDDNDKFMRVTEKYIRDNCYYHYKFYKCFSPQYNIYINSLKDVYPCETYSLFKVKSKYSYKLVNDNDLIEHINTKTNDFICQTDKGCYYLSMPKKRIINI